jgi:nicotinamidase-related amidase
MSLGREFTVGLDEACLSKFPRSLRGRETAPYRPNPAGRDQKGVMRRCGLLMYVEYTASATPSLTPFWSRRRPVPLPRRLLGTQALNNRDKGMPMLLDAEDSQLVLVDYQQRLMPSIHEGDLVVANALRLARIAKLLDVPVWATEENPDGLGATVEVLQPHVAGRVLPKMAFDATSVLLPRLKPAARPAQGGNARSLPKHLQKAAPPPPAGRETIVLAGCEAHVCLMQTALGLLEEELEVWVVTDACSSRTERNRDAAFDRLAAAGAELVTTEMVAFEWLRDAGHPRFRDVLTIVK